METGITEFDTIINLIKEANERNSKCKNKINFQIEEINKTKAIINQFEECLKQQNEMLNKLLDEKFTAKKYKDSLVEEKNKLENGDEECERSVYDNQDKFIERKTLNIKMNNDGHGSTCQDILYNNVHDDQYQTNFDMLNNCNVEPFKRDLESSAINDNLLFQSDNNEPIENDCFVPYENNDRKVLILQTKIKIPENKTSIFKDEDFIKNYSPKLILKIKTKIVAYIDNTKRFLNICYEKGMLLIFNKKTKLWSKFCIVKSKNISQYLNFNNEHHLVCENEFITFNESKIKMKQFDSNIISKLLTPCKIRRSQKNKFCYISLENGDIWRYDLTNDENIKVFSFHSKMKACVNFPFFNSSLFLTEDGKVFITHYKKSTRIPELDGCVDIIASYATISVCYFGNGICKIYDMASKKIFELGISEPIKLAKYSKSTLSLLDVQNRLYIYKFKSEAFNYEEIEVIQIPTCKNISAMSDVIDNQVYITVENEIYSIEYN